MAPIDPKSMLLATAIALSSNEAVAENSLVGLWGFGSCDDHTNIEYQGYASAVYFSDGVVNIIAQQITPLDGTEWYLVRTDPLDPAPSLMRRDGAALVHAWPVGEPDTREGIEKLNKDLASGALNPDQTPDAFDIDRGRQCAGVPFPQSLLVGEALNVLMEFDQAANSCRTALESCPRVLFDVADVTGNGELSIAEMSRIVRSSFAIGAASQENPLPEAIAATTASSAALAPLASAAVLHSFDYDRSGEVSFDELLSERLPQEFVTASDAEFRLFDWINALSQGAQQAAGAGAAMLP